MFDWFMKRTKGDHKLKEKYTLDAGNLYYDQVLSGIPSIQTADPNNRITNVYTGSSWTSIRPAVNATTPLIRTKDILEELDELREAVLLLTRDLKLEEQYPELKQAYDDYMELYRSIKIADKLAKTGDT